MDAPTYVRKQIAALRRFCQGTLNDMTDEQFNWIPPGTANSIKASLIHLLSGEDSSVQRVLQGKQPLWDSEGWKQKLGLDVRPGRDEGWDAIRATTIPLAPVLEYAEAVHAATDAYLAGLTPEELERKVDYFVPDARVADVLNILVVHEAAHSGEIAALRGMQGAKGLPM